MPHELVVLLQAKIAGLSPPELNQLANQLYPLVNGAANEVRFAVKNIGNQPFPGGKILEVSAAQSFGLRELMSRATNISDVVPTLAVGEEKPLCEWKPVFPMEGVATIRLRLEASDGEAVNLRRYENDPPRNPVEFFLPVGNAAEVLMLYLLYAIDRKLGAILALPHRPI